MKALTICTSHFSLIYWIGFQTGKGNEDKRGLTIDSGIQAKSWLYVAGNPVICSRYTEVAAIVSSINPSISATTDSLEVTSLQQSLLWVLNDMGHLTHYPMALGKDTLFK